MSQDPEFPQEAAVGANPAAASNAAPLNETLSHAVTAKQAEQRSAEKAEKEGAGHRSRWVTGAAIGVGSAAVVAALLYARSHRRSDRS
jgi:hypothetical protein